MSCVVDVSLVLCGCGIHAFMLGMIFYLNLSRRFMFMHLMFILSHHLMVHSMSVMIFIRFLRMDIMVFHFKTLPGGIRTARLLGLLQLCLYCRNYQPPEQAPNGALLLGKIPDM